MASEFYKTQNVDKLFEQACAGAELAMEVLEIADDTTSIDQVEPFPSSEEWAEIVTLARKVKSFQG
jgi:hypothetical protein